MTPKIRRVDPRDIPAICELLHENMNSTFSVERWRRLFQPNWCDGRPQDMGLVVEDAGRIVGFHGHVCSHRMIRGQRERFVNFSSWYLLKEYRGLGLGGKLVRKAIEDPESTYTVFSLSPKRTEMFRTLGMEPLENQRLLWRKRGPAEISLTTDVDNIWYRVWPEEQRFLDDNSPYGVEACLVTSSCDECLVLFTVSEKGDGTTYFDVLYRNNPRMFTELAQSIANAILPDGDAVLAADRRFALGGGLDARVETIRSPRFFKAPDRLKPEDVDLLYSELQLLDLKLD
ncbi:GNAT family N-acetyltransferase [Salidesulfovibrio onnuriiensis]|uniref:GNAT family N-acetyltransferase n=1 Tax=Salidesulfovibrio onnuriiensis TaxID=2583823 RepID=UPI00202B2AF1|nr:GNAT family N-acetyltransferase [Salidesulfovibrio onnuriiensis]